MKRLIIPEWQDPSPVEIPEELREAIPGSKLLLETLVRRGFSEPEKARAFLDPDHYSPASPVELPDLVKAAERIELALKQHEKIGVWGDFDVDGQTSTAVLVSGLRHLGGENLYHVPIRKTESHGITLAPLQEFLSQGVQLVVTCDTGITAHEAVNYAKSQGVDIIITDHHSLPAQLPDALAVVDPQLLPEDHPLRSLSGVGVAYKLIEQLCLEKNDPDFPALLLDLVALGLVADLATLTFDTRYLVQRGLQLWRSGPRPALKKILDENKVNYWEVTEETLSFIIAPRLNAVGRLDDANSMVEFLLSSDPVFLATKFNQIEGLNADRKIRCDQVFKSAQAMLEASPRLLERPLIFLGHPEWEGGVVGIVASRLVELYHKPAILLNTTDPEFARGSCRSIEGINITEALRQNSQYLAGFGGHPMAAGLAVSKANLVDLEFGLIASIKKMMAENNLSPVIPLDACIDFQKVDLDLVSDLARLSPFGPGNPPLQFVAKGISIENSSYMGKNKDHLQLTVSSPDGEIHRVVWWQGADLPQPDGMFDLLYTARASNYKGKVEVTFEWEDFRESIDQNIATRISSKKHAIERIDLRHTQAPMQELNSLYTQADWQIWSEGKTLCPFPSSPRDALENGKDIIVWSAPPSLQVIQETISRVKPKRIAWFANLPQESELSFLIPQAVAVMKKILVDHPESTLSFSEFAQSLAITCSLSKLLIIWMNARGEITLLSQDNESVHLLAHKHEADKKQADSAQEGIRDLFTEISAFRHYYLSSESIANFTDQPKTGK